MPKLSSDRAKDVRKAGQEGSKFVLLPEGRYVVKLIEVESKDSRKGDPMWVWHFETVKFLDGETTPATTGKTQRYHTVLTDKALWNLDKVFESFEVEPDTDTDELIGERIVVYINQELITSGKAEGKLGNNITDLFTLADGQRAAEMELVPAGGSTEDPGF